MLAIPLAIFYYLYLAAVLIFLLISAFNIYHLIRFGLFGLHIVVIAALYILVTVVIFITTTNVVDTIDWNATIPINFGVVPPQQ